MKISNINEYSIQFDNGSTISFEHIQDCCEYNYADFIQIESGATEFDFDEDLQFEEVYGVGFRFGSKNTPMFFIPCYSEQNGYYSSDIEVWYNDVRVLNVECQEVEG